uniref:Thioredoxin domain-containing protein n=1 Tax=Romanomermis culicivorax TaxID=13658 RepID=A0A915ITY9_ROMCU
MFSHIFFFLIFEKLIISRNHGSLILELKDNNFNDTIFGKLNRSKTANVINFYAKNCSNYKLLRPLLNHLAEDAARWSTILTIAQIDCIKDNEKPTCKQNRVTEIPALKYYPKNAQNADDAENLPFNETRQNYTELKTAVIVAIVQDYQAALYSDWPDFRYLPGMNDTKGLADYMFKMYPKHQAKEAMIIVEKDGQTLGAEIILNVSNQKNKILVRRALSTNPLFKGETSFPSLYNFEFKIAALKKVETNDIKNYVTEKYT